MIKQELKRHFPALYEQYLHLQRRKDIANIERRKKLSKSEYESEISKQYRQRIGHDIDWNNLTTYTEKMQWAKLYDNDPRKSELTDKYKVREWVEQKIGKEHLIGLLGVWDSFEEIDFSSLPDRFVLKTNHGSGTNVIVKDKQELNLKNTRQKFKDWLDTDFGYKSLELHYSAIRPKIIAEEYMEDELGELRDYKFLCFDGQPHFCWVDVGRYSNHTQDVYNMEWERQPWNKAAFARADKPADRPENFEKMVEIVKILAQDFAHVRVDLYNVDGRIYFGEMTFTNGGGFDRIHPAEYDEMLGGLWTLPKMT